MWWKLPEPLVMAIVRGEMTAADALLAVVLGLAFHVRRASLSWVRGISGLSRRAVAYALHGRAEEPRLSPWVRVGSDGPRWAPFAVWCRVGWHDLRGLLRRPTGDAVRAWAWSLLLVSSRGADRADLEVRDLARACGWSYGRAWRALWGASDRSGAVDVGLVSVEVQRARRDVVVSHYPRSLLRVVSTDRLAEALRRALDPCVHSDPATLGSALAEVDRQVCDLASSRAPSPPPGAAAVHGSDPGVHVPGSPIENLYQWIRSGSKRERRLLVELVRDRAQATGVPREDLPRMADGIADWLDAQRIAVPRGTTWDHGTIRRVVLAAAPLVPSAEELAAPLRAELAAELPRVLSWSGVLGLGDRRSLLPALRALRRGTLAELRSAVVMVGKLFQRCEIRSVRLPLVAAGPGVLP